METLHFTPLTIHEIEKERKMPLVNLITDSSIGVVALFIRKGLDLSSELEGIKKITEWMESGEEYQAIVLHIYDTLIDSRFLSPTPALKEAMEEARKLMAERKKSISE